MHTNNDVHKWRVVFSRAPMLAARSRERRVDALESSNDANPERVFLSFSARQGQVGALPLNIRGEMDKNDSPFHTSSSHSFAASHRGPPLKSHRCELIVSSGLCTNKCCHRSRHHLRCSHKTAPRHFVTSLRNNLLLARAKVVKEDSTLKNRHLSREKWTFHCMTRAIEHHSSGGNNKCHFSFQLRLAH